MREDTAQLPVDFLVGFTIFILCLIAVANFVPSLLVGLQRTSGIDYNAVAYRTGVVLVEDPGEPKGNRVLGTIYGTDFQPWELQTGDYIIRLGLALTADTPNILSINKINRFFDTGTFNDDPTSPLNDYRRKLLFSSYMYGYNVSVQNISPLKPGEPARLKKMIGQPYPAGGYGYIRRYVLIKQNSDAVINVNSSLYPDPITNPFNNLSFDAYLPEEVKEGCPCEDFPACNLILPCLRVRLPGEILYNKTIAPQYQIDLQREPFTINITNLTTVLNNSAKNPSPLALDMADNATLEYIRFFDEMGSERTSYSQLELRVDNEPWTVILNPQGEVNRKVNDTLLLFVSPLWPTTGDPSCPSCGIIGFDEYQDMDIVFSFADDNRTLIRGTFLYDYRNVTAPPLSTGMLEVGIW